MSNLVPRVAGKKAALIMMRSCLAAWQVWIAIVRNLPRVLRLLWAEAGHEVLKIGSHLPSEAGYPLH